MSYSYENQSKVKKIITLCRPEKDNIDLWVDRIISQVTVEDLKQHYSYLAYRMDDLIEQTTIFGLSMGEIEHYLELSKIAETAIYLDVVGAALRKKYNS